MRGQDGCREGSTSSVPSPETLPRDLVSVSTSLPSTSDSTSLAHPTATTPASDQGLASTPDPSGGTEPALSGPDSAGTVADDVFSTADEVFSAPDSPHKEFHCAVLRALSSEPSVVEPAKRGQATGTADKAESCLNAGLPFPSSPALPWPVLLHTTALGVWDSSPAVFSPFSEGLESVALPTHSQISEAFALLFFYLFIPCL